MNSRAAVKAVTLAFPLLVGITSLNLFGEGLTRISRRAFGGRPYVERDHGEFAIFALEGSDYDEFAFRVLRNFTDQMSSDARFGFHPSAGARIAVYLLESPEAMNGRGKTDVMRDLPNNGGGFNPRTMEILIDASQHNMTANERGLRHSMMHALMHLQNPNGKWSPWIWEGLAQYFEGPVPASILAEARSRPELLDLEKLLAARSDAFAGEGARIHQNRSLLLVKFLLEERPDAFKSYYGSRGSADFEKTFGALPALGRDWQEYVRHAK